MNQQRHSQTKHTNTHIPAYVWSIGAALYLSKRPKNQSSVSAPQKITTLSSPLILNSVHSFKFLVSATRSLVPVEWERLSVNREGAYYIDEYYKETTCCWFLPLRASPKCSLKAWGLEENSVQSSTSNHWHLCTGLHSMAMHWSHFKHTTSGEAHALIFTSFYLCTVVRKRSCWCFITSLRNT